MTNITDMTTEEFRALKEGMVQGMLWFDNGKDPLEEKIAKAVRFFKKKHNRDCKVIALHPKTFLSKEVPAEINGIPIVVDKTVLLHHIFVADEDMPNTMRGAQI